MRTQNSNGNNVSIGYIRFYKINQDSDFRFNIMAEGTRKGNRFSDINLGSYYIANANYRTKLDQGTISLSMKNIFDRKNRPLTRNVIHYSL